LRWQSGQLHQVFPEQLLQLGNPFLQMFLREMLDDLGLKVGQAQNFKNDHVPYSNGGSLKMCFFLPMKWQLIVGKMSFETFKTNGFRGVPWVSQLVIWGAPMFRQGAT